MPAVSFARYRTAALGEVRPTGWILEFLRRQCAGLTGHPDASGYPFDHEFWSAPDRLPDLADQAMLWWPYEQTAYWVDAALKAGFLAGDDRVLNMAVGQIDAAIDAVAEDGFIGPTMFRAGNRWPHHIFFRAVLAYGAVSGESRYRDALVRHYRAMPHPMGFSRDVSGVETLLSLYDETGAADLLDAAEDLYARFSEQVSDHDRDFSLAGMESDAPVSAHGVTFNEIAKLGALLFAATGDRASLDATVHAYEKVHGEHVLADGLHSAAEGMRGRDSLASHESCNIADYTWSLGRLAVVTGDARFADRIEKVIHNALPGSVMKDFTALQYFSCPNQLVSTATSNHNAMSRGDNRMTFRPGHPVQCCTGNIQRSMPNFVDQMWWRGRNDGTDEIVAALFGPSTFEGVLGGVSVTIEEATAYPFQESVAFHISAQSPARFTFGVRIPGWCPDAALTVNGRPLEERLVAGTFHRMDREWRSGDRVDLKLPFVPTLQHWPDDGLSVDFGPLTLSLPVAGRPQPDTVQDWEQTPTEFRLSGPQVREDGFPNYLIEPDGTWAYALAVDDQDIATTARIAWGDPSDFGFDVDSPAVRVSVPVRRVRDWTLVHVDEVTRELPSFADGRFRMIESVVPGEFVLTPPLPESASLADRLSDDIEWIDLVPYGATLLRLTVFPNGLAG